MTAIETTFLERTRASAAHAAKAAEVMPGGDTRAAGHHPPYQLTMVRGEGAHLTDLDGHRYLDLIGNFTSLCHGNAYAPIVEAALPGVSDLTLTVFQGAFDATYLADRNLTFEPWTLPADRNTRELWTRAPADPTRTVTR